MAGQSNPELPGPQPVLSTQLNRPDFRRRNIGNIGKMAERKGFEPSRRFPVYSLSRGAPSTTRPPLRSVPFSGDSLWKQALFLSQGSFSTPSARAFNRRNRQQMHRALQNVQVESGTGSVRWFSGPEVVSEAAARALAILSPGRKSLKNCICLRPAARSAGRCRRA